MMTCTTLDKLAKYDVVLASNSPRRRELLSMLDVKFRIAIPKDVDESYPDSLPSEDVPEFLARKKAEAYLEQLWKPGELVITSDTVVIHNNKVLGKPQNITEAKAMLHSLADDSHIVVSGVAVSDGSKIKSLSAKTIVEFGSLTDEEINYYVDRYNPLDKAGAYGIQEWIGCVAVSRIDGSFYNVMGLPIHRLYSLLTSF